MARAPGDDDDDTIHQGTVGGPASDQDTHTQISNGGGPSDDLIMRSVARIDVQQAEVDKRMADLKAAQKGMKTLRQQIKGDGVKLKNLDAAMAKRGLARHEQRSDIEEQDRYDRLLGNETWETADLFGRTADGAKDEVDHESDGYAAGKRLLPPKAPETVPPEMRPHWMRGHDRGTTEAMKALGGEKPKPIIEGGDEPAEEAPKPAAKSRAPRKTKAGETVQ